jgi:UDP-N-acetylmuramoyl-tripeptide--D-alanyl-D-alanine ligase
MMRYRWRDIPFLLLSRQGRKSILAGQLARFGPAIRFATTLYRRTVLRKVRVVAVIGSLGKSTTARAVAAAIGHRQPDGVSNAGNALAFDLLKQSSLSGNAILEAGINGPGIMKKSASMLRPDIVIVTSIASEHILSFGTLENTRNEKAEMLRVLTPQKTAILNADDHHVMWMSTQTPARIITCGFSASADVRAEELRFNSSGGMAFTIKSGSLSFPVKVSIPGRHMVFPILAAVAVAMIEGRELSSAIAAMENMKALDGRMQSVKLASGALLIRDDFKSNRESVTSALETVKEIPARRRVLVLGGVSEIQNRDWYGFWREMGKTIADSVDYAVLFLQKNSFRRCRNEAVAAGMNPENIVRSDGDPVSALPLLPQNMAVGDVILVKGRNDLRISRLSLSLMGRKVKCRITGCRLAADCSECELLEKPGSGSPLLGPNLKRNQ